MASIPIFSLKIIKSVVQIFKQMGRYWPRMAYSMADRVEKRAGNMNQRTKNGIQDLFYLARGWTVRYKSFNAIFRSKIDTVKLRNITIDCEIRTPEVKDWWTESTTFSTSSLNAIIPISTPTKRSIPRFPTARVKGA